MSCEHMDWEKSRPAGADRAVRCGGRGASQSLHRRSGRRLEAGAGQHPGHRAKAAGPESFDGVLAEMATVRTASLAQSAQDRLLVLMFAGLNIQHLRPVMSHRLLESRSLRWTVRRRPCRVARLTLARNARPTTPAPPEAAAPQRLLAPCFPEVRSRACGYVRSALSGVRPHFVHDGCGRHGARFEVIENEKADCRGQIALLAIAVDLAHQFRQGQVPDSGYLLHPVPEGLFEADAGLVTGHDD